MRDSDFIVKCRSVQERAIRLGYPETAAVLEEIIANRCVLNQRLSKETTATQQYQAQSLQLSKLA